MKYNAMISVKEQMRPLSVYFHSFQTMCRIKTADFSGIRTLIDGVEGEHPDHLTTTTTAQCTTKFYLIKFVRRYNMTAPCSDNKICSTRFRRGRQTPSVTLERTSSQICSLSEKDNNTVMAIT